LIQITSRARSTQEYAISRTNRFGALVRTTSNFATLTKGLKMIPHPAYAAIEALDLTPVRARLMHPVAGPGWSAERTRQVEHAYREFLFVATMFPDESPAPAPDVDTYWHFHILDTVKYARDCQQAFGYFLHHGPDTTPRRALDWRSSLRGLNAACTFQTTGAHGPAVNAESYCAAAQPASADAQASYCAAAQPAAAAADVSYCSLTQGALHEDTSSYCSLTSAGAEASQQLQRSPSGGAAASYCAVAGSLQQDAAGTYCAVARIAASTLPTHEVALASLR
jgi:hypothetical protein